MAEVPGSKYPIPRSWRKSIAKEAREQLRQRLVSIIADPVAIRVEGFGGVFEIGPASDLFSRVWVDGDYEPEIREALERWLDPARDVLDVGANVGFFSVWFAQRARRVVAVEPTPRAHQLLCRNIRRNGCEDRVIPVCGALVESPGKLMMEVVPGQEEYSTTGKLSHGAVADSESRSIEVDGMTMDEVVAAQGLDPALVKIDVEGGEAGVLRGGLQTIERCRPVIIAELSPSMLEACGSTVAEVLDPLRERGYRLLDPSGSELLSRQYGRSWRSPKSAIQARLRLLAEEISA